MIARHLCSACRLGVSHSALPGPSQALAVLHWDKLHLSSPALDIRSRCRSTAAAQESFKVMQATHELMCLRCKPWASLTHTSDMQRPSPKRPPRFFVPPNLLNEDSVGTTFQLNINETHHALRCPHACRSTSVHMLLDACMPGVACMTGQHVGGGAAQGAAPAGGGPAGGVRRLGYHCRGPLRRPHPQQQGVRGDHRQRQTGAAACACAGACDSRVAGNLQRACSPVHAPPPW